MCVFVCLIQKLCAYYEEYYIKNIREDLLPRMQIYDTCIRLHNMYLFFFFFSIRVHMMMSVFPRLSARTECGGSMRAVDHRRRSVSGRKQIFECLRDLTPFFCCTEQITHHSSYQAYCTIPPLSP